VAGPAVRSVGVKVGTRAWGARAVAGRGTGPRSRAAWPSRSRSPPWSSRS